MITGHHSADVAIADTAIVQMTSKKVLLIPLKITTTIAERCCPENQMPVKRKKPTNKRSTKVESIQHSFPELQRAHSQKIVL